MLRIKCEFQGKDTEKLKIIFAIPTEKERGEVAGLIRALPYVHSYEF